MLGCNLIDSAVLRRAAAGGQERRRKPIPSGMRLLGVRSRPLKKRAGSPFGSVAVAALRASSACGRSVVARVRHCHIRGYQRRAVFVPPLPPVGGRITPLPPAPPLKKGGLSDGLRRRRNTGRGEASGLPACLLCARHCVCPLGRAALRVSPRPRCGRVRHRNGLQGGR